MKEWWQSLEKRERLFVAGLGVFMSVFLLYILLLEPLFSGAAEYREMVATAEADLAYMQSVAPQLRAMRGQNRTVVSTGPITGIVDAALRSHGIRTEKMQAVGENGLRVVVDNTPFDSIVGCLGELSSRHQIAIEAANLRKGGATGTTDGALTLRAQR